MDLNLPGYFETLDRCEELFAKGQATAYEIAILRYLLTHTWWNCSHSRDGRQQYGWVNRKWVKYEKIAAHTQISLDKVKKVMSELSKNEAITTVYNGSYADRKGNDIFLDFLWWLTDLPDPADMSA
jgi:hypothetical protein